jgi:hypothetical protein
VAQIERGQDHLCMMVVTRSSGAQLRLQLEHAEDVDDVLAMEQLAAKEDERVVSRAGRRGTFGTLRLQVSSRRIGVLRVSVRAQTLGTTFHAQDVRHQLLLRRRFLAVQTNLKSRTMDRAKQRMKE